MTLIKICGVTSADDAAFAAACGADFIGFILSQSVRRGVSIQTAQQLVDACRAFGAKPIAVFPEGTFETIVMACEILGVNAVQLHGRKTKNLYPLLHSEFECVYALHVHSDGSYDDNEVEQVKAKMKYLVADSGGGSGIPFQWASFRAPRDCRWFMAGGISPNNVIQALRFKPHGIDVSSGVERAGTTFKDPILVKKLIQTIREYDAAS